LGKSELFVFPDIFVEKTNKRKEFSKHAIVPVWRSGNMVYSNALYFASQFDKLTDEVLSSFSAKEKPRKLTTE